MECILPLSSQQVMFFIHWMLSFLLQCWCTRRNDYHYFKVNSGFNFQRLNYNVEILNRVQSTLDFAINLTQQQLPLKLMPGLLQPLLSPPSPFLKHKFLEIVPLLHLSTVALSVLSTPWSISVLLINNQSAGAEARSPTPSVSIGKPEWERETAHERMKREREEIGFNLSPSISIYLHPWSGPLCEYRS